MNEPEFRWLCFNHHKPAIWGGSMFYPWCEKGNQNTCDVHRVETGGRVK